MQSVDARNDTALEPAGLIELKTSSEEILNGHFLKARRDTVKLPDGSLATREYIIHPGAVMMVAQLGDGRVVLERQYRYPVQSVMIEFPAGKLDAGESSLKESTASMPPIPATRPAAKMRIV